MDKEDHLAIALWGILTGVIATLDNEVINDAQRQFNDILMKKFGWEELGD